jgi:hypothetical protein
LYLIEEEATYNLPVVVSAVIAPADPVPIGRYGRLTVPALMEKLWVVGVVLNIP